MLRGKQWRRHRELRSCAHPTLHVLAKADGRNLRGVSERETAMSFAGRGWLRVNLRIVFDDDGKGSAPHGRNQAKPNTVQIRNTGVG